MNLERLCDRERPDTSPLHAPFWVEIDGRRYACATNGHFMVAKLDAAEGLRPCPESEPSVQTHLLPDPGAVSVAVDVAVFGAYCGDPEWPVKCSTCAGTSEGTCMHCDAEDRPGMCDDCNGTGFYYTDARPAWVGPTMFNLQLMARALDVLGVKGGSAVLQIVPSQPLRELPLRLIADDWRVVLMPMRNDSTCGTRVPAAVVAWPGAA